jgi:hypothetical protein
MAFGWCGRRLQGLVRKAALRASIDNQPAELRTRDLNAFQIVATPKGMSQPPTIRAT